MGHVEHMYMYICMYVTTYIGIGIENMQPVKTPAFSGREKDIP